MPTVPTVPAVPRQRLGYRLTFANYAGSSPQCSTGAQYRGNRGGLTSPGSSMEMEVTFHSHNSINRPGFSAVWAEVE